MTPTKQYDPIVLYYALKAGASLPVKKKSAHKENYTGVLLLKRSQPRWPRLVVLIIARDGSRL